MLIKMLIKNINKNYPHIVTIAISKNQINQPYTNCANRYTDHRIWHCLINRNTPLCKFCLINFILNPSL